MPILTFTCKNTFGFFWSKCTRVDLDVWTLAKEMYAEHNQLTFRTQDLEMSLQRKINMGMPKNKNQKSTQTTRGICIRLKNPMIQWKENNHRASD